MAEFFALKLAFNQKMLANTKICFLGVVVFDKNVLVGVLFWQFIQAVNFSNRKLTLVLDEHSSTEVRRES